MPAQDFDLILRVQADLQTAVGELRSLNDQMRVVKSTATEASGGLQSLTSAASKTEAGVRGISAQLKSFGVSATTIGGQLRTLAGAVASLVVIREIASFVQNVIEADQAIGDMAQKVGVSTEALSALGAVAKRNGSDLQGVQQAFVNLARAGTGLNQTGVRALQAMNISLKQFQELNPEQQFDLVAQKFSGYSDGANKAALATALLGKSGADLIPTLNQVGQEGLQNLTNQAIAAGTAVGQGAVSAAQKFSNALQTLNEKLQGAVNQGLVQFTPEIDHLNDLFSDPKFQQSLADIALGIAKVGTMAIEAAGKVAEFTRNAAEVLAFNQTGSVQSDAGDAAANARLSADRAELAMRSGASPRRPPTISYSHSGSEQIRAIALSTKDLQKEITDLSNETARYTKNRDDANKANAQAGDTRGLFAGEGGKTKAPIVAPTGGASDASNQLMQQAAKAQDDLTQALIALQSQLNPTAAIYAKYNDTVKKANDEAALAKQAAGANAQAIDTQRDAVVQLAGSVRDAALDALAEKDRQAWEALKRSFETPAQVAVDDALKQIRQLNELMKDGTHSASEYQAMLAQIGTASVPKAPQYQGPDAAVGGAFGELQKNSKALADLEAWHQSVLGANASFHAKSAAEEEAYQARMKAIEQTYSTQRVQIEKARGMLTLQASEEAFGQLAALTSSSNRTLAAIGRAAAIVQAGLSLAINVAKASEVGFPLNIGFIAGAIAQGATIFELISQAGSGGSGGYSQGGWTGNAPVTQAVGVVHGREGVLSAPEVQAIGGESGFNALRRAIRNGYADGGFVHPLANAPSPAAMGFAAPTSLPIASIAGSAANDDARGRQAAAPNVKVVMVQNADQLAAEILNTPTGTKLVIQHVGDNPRTIQGRWGSG